MSDLYANLLKYNKHQKYICIDVECCNLNLISGDNLPFEIGLLMATRDEILFSKNIYIKWPELKISADAARITNYDKNFIDEKGIDPLEALKEVDKYIYDPSIRVLFFNGLGFDAYVLNIFRKKLGFSTDYSYLQNAYDIRALYMIQKLQVPWDNNKSPYFQQLRALNYHRRGFKSNLTYASKDMGISVDETKTHGGLYDVSLTFQIFQKLLSTMELK